MRKTKRVIIVSDLHSGHRVGLTPPPWQEGGEEGSSRQKFGLIQEQLYNEYLDIVKSLGKADLLIVNGDCVDGKGKKSKGSEQITTDCEEQGKMAAHAIKEIDVDCIIMTYGTAYHTGEGEDWENQVAKEIEAAKIGAHEWIEVNGVMFDVKHQCGSSSTPQGRHTAVAGQRYWNLLWNERELAPKADVIIRSHVHYFNYCGGPNWLAMTTPALQGLGSKFGARRCSGIVDFGIIHFDIEPNGRYSWQAHIRTVERQKAKAIKL